MMEKHNTGRRSMNAYELVVSSDIHVKEALRRLTIEDPESGYPGTELFFFADNLFRISKTPVMTFGRI